MVLGGVPQGSVLGPLLFNIFVNNLHFCATKTYVNVYADDNQLHFSHECPTAIETAINEDLKESTTWFKENLKQIQTNSKVLAWPLDDLPLI